MNAADTLSRVIARIQDEIENASATAERVKPFDSIKDCSAGSLYRDRVETLKRILLTAINRTNATREKLVECFKKNESDWTADEILRNQG